MCGRLVLIKYATVDGSIAYYRMWTGKGALDDMEQLKKVFLGQSRFDIRPTQIIDVFTVNPATGKHETTGMKWGWQPEWTNGKPIINTRKEGAAQNRMWGKAFREGRCVIAASHFYEWQRREDAHRNVPWMIKRTGHDYMYFAGLYVKRKLASGEEVAEVSILTEPGNKLMTEIHNHGGNAGRQPVFIDEDLIPEWLNPQLQDSEKILTLLRPIEDGEFEAEMLEEIGNDKTHTPPKPRQQNLF